MNIILKQTALLCNSLFSNRWSRILLIFIVIFVIAVTLMPILEGPDSQLASLSNCVWWFVVTVTTVGYGDITPITLAGRALNIFVMISGIGIAAALIGDASVTIIESRRKKMQGLAQLKVNNHIIIFGYIVGKTEELVEEILADEKRKPRKIVLCADQGMVGENPMPETVEFIKGDLSSDSVMKRSCIERADKIIIRGATDERTVLIAIAVRECVKDSAEIIAYVEKSENAIHLERLDKSISVIRSLAGSLIVQETQDRGVSALIYELLSNKFGEEFYRVDIPKDIGKEWSFGYLFMALKRQYGNIVVAINGVGKGFKINPSVDFQITGGMSLYMIAENRPTNIDWMNI